MMARLNKLALGATFGALAILLALDVWLAEEDGGSKATISWNLYELAKQYPILPFGAGILMGHLWWVQHETGE